MTQSIHPNPSPAIELATALEESRDKLKRFDIYMSRENDITQRESPSGEFVYASQAFIALEESRERDRVLRDEVANKAAAVELILRDISETDPFDPDHKDAICISYEHLKLILDNYLAPSAPQPVLAMHDKPLTAAGIHVYGYRPNCSECAGVGCSDCVLVMQLCEDCPPAGYPTDKTRCTPCPRRTALCGDEK